MRLLFAAGLMALAAACSPAAPAAPTAEDVAAESEKLTDYLNAEFEEELAMNPMHAHAAWGARSCTTSSAISPRRMR